MKYTYQDIIKLQNEAEVSFEIADKALKKARGHYNKSLYIAMKKKKRQGKRTKTTNDINDIFRKVFAYRFIASKGNHTYINIRVWILLIMGFFLSGFLGNISVLVVVPLIISFFFNVEFRLSNTIKKADESTVNIEPVKESIEKDEEHDYNLSEEKIEDEDDGFVKVEIDK